MKEWWEDIYRPIAKRAVSLTNVLPTISVMSEYEQYEWGPMSSGLDEGIGEAKSEGDQLWEHIQRCQRWNDNKRYWEIMKYMSAFNTCMATTSICKFGMSLWETNAPGPQIISASCIMSLSVLWEWMEINSQFEDDVQWWYCKRRVNLICSELAEGREKHEVWEIYCPIFWSNAYQGKGKWLAQDRCLLGYLSDDSVLIYAWWKVLIRQGRGGLWKGLQLLTCIYKFYIDLLNKNFESLQSCQGAIKKLIYLHMVYFYNIWHLENPQSVGFHPCLSTSQWWKQSQESYGLVILMKSYMNSSQFFLLLLCQQRCRKWVCIIHPLQPFAKW
jgi:hypothetical protein